MRVVKVVVNGLPLFKNGGFTLDLYASDRVARNEEGKTPDVTHLGRAGSLYSQNVLGLVGVNASGKTTTLNMIDYVISYLTDRKVSRHLARESNRIGRMADWIEIAVVFQKDNSFYLLESTLRCERSEVGASGCVHGDDLAFVDETLWRLDLARPKRAHLDSLNEFKASASVIVRRNGDSSTDPTVLSEQERMFLDDHESIASRMTGRNGITVSRPAGELPRKNLPGPVLRAFDPSIESLSFDPELQVYHLTFRGEKERVMGPDAIPSFLSQGTIVGAEMVQFALERLKDGGYMIIDEIETSLNRSLVGVIIGLFASPATNPHGAQLIFSTHVPEILDEVHRKDAVYVLRRDAEFKSEVVRYSAEVKRIENKKSATILRNVIRGSLPNYPDVQAMRLYVKEQLDG